MRLVALACVAACLTGAHAESAQDQRLPTLLNEFADTVADFRSLVVKWEVRYETSKGIVMRTENVRTMYKGDRYRQELASLNEQKKVDSRSVTLLSNGKLYTLTLPQRTMSVKSATPSALKTQECPLFLPYMSITNARIPDTEAKPYNFESRVVTLTDFEKGKPFKAFSMSLLTERDSARLEQKLVGDAIEVRLNTGALIADLPIVNALLFPPSSRETLYPSTIKRFFVSKSSAGKPQEGLADTFTIRETQKVKYKASGVPKLFTIPKVSELAFHPSTPENLTQKMIFTVESVLINEEVDDQEFDPDLTQADSFFDRDTGKLLKQP